MSVTSSGEWTKINTHDSFLTAQDLLQEVSKLTQVSPKNRANVSSELQVKVQVFVERLSVDVAVDWLYGVMCELGKISRKNNELEDDFEEKVGSENGFGAAKVDSDGLASSSKFGSNGLNTDSVGKVVITEFDESKQQTKNHNQQNQNQNQQTLTKHAPAAIRLILKSIRSGSAVELSEQINFKKFTKSDDISVTILADLASTLNINEFDEATIKTIYTKIQEEKFLDWAPFFNTIFQFKLEKIIGESELSYLLNKQSLTCGKLTCSVLENAGDQVCAWRKLLLTHACGLAYWDFEKSSSSSSKKQSSGYPNDYVRRSSCSSFGDENLNSNFTNSEVDSDDENQLYEDTEISFDSLHNEAGSIGTPSSHINRVKTEVTKSSSTFKMTKTNKSLRKQKRNEQRRISNEAISKSKTTTKTPLFKSSHLTKLSHKWNLYKDLKSNIEKAILTQMMKEKYPLYVIEEYVCTDGFLVEIFEKYLNFKGLRRPDGFESFKIGSGYLKEEGDVMDVPSSSSNMSPKVSSKSNSSPKISKSNSSLKTSQSPKSKNTKLRKNEKKEVISQITESDIDECAMKPTTSLIQFVNELKENHLKNPNSPKPIVALDAEWRDPKPISLLQLAIVSDFDEFCDGGDKSEKNKGDRKNNSKKHSSPTMFLIEFDDDKIRDTYDFEFQEALKYLLLECQVLAFSPSEDWKRLCCSFLFQDIFDSEQENNFTIPENWKDLQMDFSNGRSTPGLQACVELVFEDIDFCKKMQTSNWDRRPLEVEQIKYASRDALILLHIEKALQNKSSKLTNKLNVFRNFGIENSEVKLPTRRVKLLLPDDMTKLCKKLRGLGIDTEFVPRGFTRKQILERAEQQNRVAIIRETKADCKLNQVGKFVTISPMVNPNEQMRDLIKIFDLDISSQRFCGRCVHCNSDDWISMSREEASKTGKVLERTLQVYTDFWCCGGCGKVYWEGAMFEKAVTDFRQFLPTIDKDENANENAPNEPKLERKSTDYEELREKGWSEQRIRAQKLRDGVEVCSREDLYKGLPPF